MINKIYGFSKKGIDKLHTCHPFLQELMFNAIRNSMIDFSILCGHRNKDEQEIAYRSGNSNAKFGESKHNSVPSLAVDIAPYPIDWDDINRFESLGEHIIKCFDDLKFKNADLIWGKYFKKLVDYGHFELRIYE